MLRGVSSKVPESGFWRGWPCSPVLTEHRVVQNNLLQKLNELVGKVSGHEGLDGDRHFLRILGLRQGCLNNLRGENSMVSVTSKPSSTLRVCHSQSIGVTLQCNQLTNV